MPHDLRLSAMDKLAAFTSPHAELTAVDGIPCVDIKDASPGLLANIHYYNHPQWMADWIRHVHRDEALRDRWHATAGDWTDKTVVDVGCGPGNLFQNIGGTPRSLIGVDVAIFSLKIAETLGYTPLLADAHAIPLQSGFADIVALNGTVHHCQDMRQVIVEAARLVKPGGAIVIDHDPQKTAWHYKGLGRLMWELRKPIYRLLKRGGHSPEDDEQKWALATEIHHQPGDGLSETMLRSILEPLDFDVKIYPHNHTVGREILQGKMGKKPLKYHLGQWMSGINSTTPPAALSLLCVGLKAVKPVVAIETPRRTPSLVH